MVYIIFFLYIYIDILTIIGFIIISLNINFNNILFSFLFSNISNVIYILLILFLSKYIYIYNVNNIIIKNIYNKTPKWLLNIVKIQSKINKIKTPKVIIYNSNIISLFTYNIHHKSSLITLSSRIIKKMNKKDMEFIIAHEMSHIINCDNTIITMFNYIINTLIIFISQIINNIIYIYLSISFYQNDINFLNKIILIKNILYNIIYIIILFIIDIIINIISNIFICWYSRYREYKADYFSVNLIGYKKSISALYKLKKYTKIYPLSKSNGSKLFFIYNIPIYITNKLFINHPTINKRIYELKKIYKK